MSICADEDFINFDLSGLESLIKNQI